ncbi:glycoside hydrolase family 2 protein [Caulobacter segnis]|uniref:Beta-galactosidase n=2 Tax=Caulobacter segnis TaxID=88688 RepID=D5VGI0_CAUST|nr:beta-galactosidase GalA [Caulobacter segnis]ADG10299.1 Beta-galactosidase [Caulobacter segnis ATCC 21756]AVQ02034.1 glycoside hydrolase family 2 protein [Caulobacter segnis]
MPIDRRTLIHSLPVAGAAIASLAPASGSAGSANSSPRQRIRLDQGWRFALGHAADPDRDFGFGDFQRTFAKQGRAAGPLALTGYDDSRWREVTLPHDWAVELPFVNNIRFSRNPADKDDEDLAAAHGYKPIGRNFPETSVGWYRLTLPVSPSDAQGRVALEFDGAFRDATVIVNGYIVTQHHGGYASFGVDITEFLNTDGAPDVLLVRLDASLGEGWFYEGAGLYRHVWLVKTTPVFVPQWGVFARASRDGQVEVDVEVANRRETGADVRIEALVLDAGAPVASAQAAQSVAAWRDTTARLTCKVASPRLWSTDAPNLYVLRVTLREGETVRDVYDVSFGFREFRFDAREGFFLNDRPLKLKGVNNHQDHAGVGAAIPDALQIWRLKQLKALGANAYRAAHNPPTPELLDACDALGLLVIDETRQMSSAPEPMDELRRLVRRDRNHPCVMLWSIGNEEPQQGTARGAKIAKAMAREIRDLDPTRKITAAMNKGYGEGITEAIDVMGFNYHEELIEPFRLKYPDMPIIGTETASAVSTRGEYARDDKRSVVSSYDVDAPYWGKTAQAWWKLYNAKPYLLGGFVWTGFDYRGEPTPFNWWPSVSSNFGILDLCGLPKDIFYYYQAWWRDDLPVLHLLPHWNWEGQEGKAVEVWAYTNLDAVELFLNGRSLGRQSPPKDGHVQWSVPYAPGRLVAYGFRGGKVVLKSERSTAGTPARLVIETDRTRLTADGQDVAVINVSVRDKAGVIVPKAAVRVDFDLIGAGRLIGVGNGDPNCHEPDKADYRTTYNGWAQALVQTRKAPGDIRLMARAEGLTSAAVALSSR